MEKLILTLLEKKHPMSLAELTKLTHNRMSDLEFKATLKTLEDTQQIVMVSAPGEHKLGAGTTTATLDWVDLPKKD